MEEDIRETKKTSSSVSFTAKQEKIQDRLKEAVEIAEERGKYEAAHDEELQRALTIVADFIRRRRRVCYGGTAMNAILPASKQFYDPELDVPDYDFYTPDMAGDVEELVRDLKAAGFKDVYHRVGIHEGTKKILVNFVAVADISLIEPDLFSVFLKRSIVKEGIHYTDPDILRMMMYLELSRPKGQVSRWSKVFERLQLINAEFPPAAGAGGGAAKRCKTQPQQHPQRHKGSKMTAQHAILEYILSEQRVLCNGPLLGLYTRGIRSGNAVFRWPETTLGPLLFTSPAPKDDALRLKTLLKRSGDVSLFVHKARGEIVPERYEVRVDGTMVCLILQEVACHSYNNIPLKDGRILCIGSPEFLITLYLSLHLFSKHSREILGPDPMCLVGALVGLAQENYLSKQSQFPPFSLLCRGHQTGYATLIRQKVLRIQREKEEVVESVGSRAKTQKKRRAAARAPAPAPAATKKKKAKKD